MIMMTMAVMRMIRIIITIRITIVIIWINDAKQSYELIYDHKLQRC